MTKKKHVPQRTCIGCRTVKDKREMIRVIRTPSQTVAIDLTGKANGRGVYVCAEMKCVEKGLTRGRLAQALKITPSDETVNELICVAQDELSKA